MGRQSRMKREKRAEIDFVSSLTATHGSWLEHKPDTDELARIRSAEQMLASHRVEAQALGEDREAFNRMSLQVFRDERWEPLSFDDWLIEGILAEHGEPPIVLNNEDPAFSNYLLLALGTIASGRVRRALAEQARRFIPQYVAQGQLREALIIGHNAYMTVMSDAATPLLVQMLVGGLARWYDEHEEFETSAMSEQGEE